MVKLSLTISFLFGFACSYGQTRHELDKDTTHYKNAPLYVLQLPLTNQIEATGIVIKPDDIDSISVFKDSTSIKEYGANAANGVIIFQTKKYLKILTLSELLTSYQITDKNLPVFIDSAIAYKPANYYFDQKVIKSVTVQKESNTGVKYISILSIFPIHHPKPGEMHIRGNVYDVKVN